MLTLSEGHKPNYTAEVVEIKTLAPHPNADRLQIATINFQPVIVGLNTKIGDIGVYVPVESVIDELFLHVNNMYSSQLLNIDTSQKGYIGKKGRVKATKLRGEYSMGLFLPAEQFGDEMKVGDVFDTYADGLFIKKYEVIKNSPGMKSSQGQKPEQSRLVDGQVHLHVDTENLRRNMYKLSLDDNIAISYKYHGTSATFQNVLVRKELSWYQKLLRYIGASIKDTEYDLVYTSRRVVKNRSFKTSDLGYYDSDPWAETAQKLNLPKGVCVYGEIVGYQSTGAWIQKGYDYGCSEGEHKFIAYRVSFTNPEGIVFNLSTIDASKYCEAIGIDFADIMYSGSIRNLLKKYRINQTEHRQENLLLKLEEVYNEGLCAYCDNEVPEEGIIIRKERFEAFEAYKLKSRRFLEHETKMLDEETKE